MSDPARHRRPAVFGLDDPRVILAPPETEAGGAFSDLVPTAAAEAGMTASPPARRVRWGTLFWSALGGLAGLALTLAVTALVEQLFARSTALGWLAAVLAALAALAAVIIAGREIAGLARLGAIDDLRARAATALDSDDHAAALRVTEDLAHLTRHMPRLARARAALEGHATDIIDGADLVRLAERELMTPLDLEARRLVSAAAKRVSVVTAVSPRAAVDILFVTATAFGLIRRLAYLYGARPGGLGLVRLARLVVAHLTVTGGMAVGDSFVQQVVGHGVAAKLSARLGEGVLNGILTARLGLAAIEVIRPLPFAALPAPALRDLAGEVLRRRDDGAAQETTRSSRGDAIR